MPLDKDSYANTFVVAVLLCLCCSMLVSVAAVGLKPIKKANIQLDQRKNLLQVTGFTSDDISEAGGVNELFELRFEPLIIDLDTGEVAIEQCKQALDDAKKQVSDVVAQYDQVWASKSKKPEVSDKLSKKEDIAGIKYREKFSHVFILKTPSGEVEKYVFPVRGYGLWSMLKGYMAIEPDLETVAGLTFYEHAETPGLGGEVDNPQWKMKWPGKEIYQDGDVALSVAKGDQSGNEYAVDALSGATITSNGVSNMIEFWMGPTGFKPFIKQQKAETRPEASASLPAIDNPSSSGVTNG